MKMAHAKGWLSWCPNGCGKKVYFIRGYAGGNKPYYCPVCKGRFTKVKNEMQN